MGIIGSIRKHAWIAVALVALAIVAFIISDDGFRNLFTPSNTFAKINGEEITYQNFDSEVAKRKELISDAQKDQMLRNGMDVEQEVRTAVWEEMLLDKLTQPEYEALGLEVSAAELNGMFYGKVMDPFVMSNLADPMTGAINTEAVKAYVEHFNELDEAQQAQWIELQNSAVKNRQQRKYSMLMSKSFYTPNALAKMVAEMNANVVDARLIALPLESVADAEVELTDADYQNYYNQHKEEFRQMEEVRMLQFVRFDVTPTQADLAKIQGEVMTDWDELQATTDEDMPFFVNSKFCHYDSTYKKAADFVAPFDTLIPRIGAGNYIEPMQLGNMWYMGKVLAAQSRPDSLRATVVYVLNEKSGRVTRTDEAAKLRADSVAAMLKGNVPTADILAQYSDMPSNGLDTMWLPDGAFAPFNDDVINTPVNGVFTFNEPSGAGYFVVKVTGKTQPSMKYRVAIIDHEIAPSSETHNNVNNEATKFMGQNHSCTAMTAAAQEQNLDLRGAPVRMMDYQVQGLGNVREMVRWAFEKDVKAGDVAKKVFETEHSYIVAAVQEVYAKGYIELAQIKSEIEPLVRLEKKKDMLMAKAQEATKANKDLNTLAVKLNATIDTVEGITFNSRMLGGHGLEYKVIGAIATAKTKGVLAPIKGSGAVYIVEPYSIKAQETADLLLPIRSEMAQKGMQKGNVQLLLQILKQKADIKDQRNLYY